MLVASRHRDPSVCNRRPRVVRPRGHRRRHRHIAPGREAGHGQRTAPSLSQTAQQPGHPYVDTITVDVDLHLVLPPGQPSHHGNHSCDPNLWWTDAYTLAARRDITAGEEVTSDYATCSGTDDFTMSCSCKSPLCRNIITSADWGLPELQARYGDHWVPALIARIQRS